MNAAARLVHQNVLLRQLVLTHILTRKQIAMMLLTLTVLLSGISVIYMTYMTRILHASYQHNLIEFDRLNKQRGQLLLERSTWMAQSRIQEVAETKLAMVMPNRQSVIIVHE
jgi:cell division protein FtsL